MLPSPVALRADDDALRELQRARWPFCRVAHSRFVLDPDEALVPVWRTLADHGVDQWRHDQMEALDERTLDAIATIICGDDSTYYRRAADPAVFFRRAGWEDVPDYDGDSRRSWTFTHLRRRREDTAAIGRVLLRLADRREYPNDPDAAEEARERVNGYSRPRTSTLPMAWTVGPCSRKALNRRRRHRTI
jgi:hypothetical protein